MGGGQDTLLTSNSDPPEWLPAIAAGILGERRGGASRNPAPRARESLSLRNDNLRLYDARQNVRP